MPRNISSGLNWLAKVVIVVVVVVLLVLDYKLFRAKYGLRVNKLHKQPCTVEP